MKFFSKERKSEPAQTQAQAQAQAQEGNDERPILQGRRGASSRLERSRFAGLPAAGSSPRTATATSTPKPTVAPEDLRSDFSKGSSSGRLSKGRFHRTEDDKGKEQRPKLESGKNSGRLHKNRFHEPEEKETNLKQPLRRGGNSRLESSRFAGLR